MKQKKIPMRTCVISHEKCPKKDLIRVVRTPDNKVVVDETGKQNGRGAYLKKDKSVIEKARTSKTLERHLETTIDDSIYDELVSLCD